MTPVGNSMPAVSPIQEIAELLAAALMRLKDRKSSGNFRPSGESSLHCSPDQSGDHPVVEKRQRA